jgi:hypothetical protein
VKRDSKRRPPRQRNFVAKNAQESGAGRHKDKKADFRRQPKHRNKEIAAW